VRNAENFSGGDSFLERFGLHELYVAMSELAPEPRPRGQTGLLIATVLVIIVAIVAGLVWKQTRDRTGPGSTTAAAPQTTPAQDRSTTVAQNAQAANSSDKSLEQLRQQVKDLETARQDLSQKVDATKQQLSQNEGDIKLLSQQLGALSERVDGLSGSRASMPNGAGRRKRSKSR
jgi:septal ring factor EnvC (AmiA/AmiB activator)